MNGKIIIAGGTGYIGTYWSNYFKSLGYNLIIITRGESFINNKVKFINWNDSWQKEINEETIIINLAGKSINCLFTDKNKKLLLNSRIDATKQINKAIITTNNPPKLFINASGISIYKSNLPTQQDEIHFEYGVGFLSELSKKWEEAFYSIETPKTRKVAVRLAPVLGKESHAIKPLKKVVILGLGGKQGSGKQYFSWIHEHDLACAIQFIIENNEIEGSLNLTSPNSVTNTEFMRAFRRQMKVKIGMPTSAFLLYLSKYFNKVEPELILDGLKIHPKRLLDYGFKFQFKTIKEALENC